MGNPGETTAAEAVAGKQVLAAALGGSQVKSTASRPRCEHGEKCFRKNPEHKAEFSHPGDVDWSVSCLECTSASAPLPVVEEGVEDRGLMGAVGGAAAVAGAGALAHQAGGLEWARKRPGLALAAGTAAVPATVTF